MFSPKEDGAVSKVTNFKAETRQCRTLLNGLQNGGPAGLIYGYIFVWCGASLQALVMGEMASMYVEAHSAKSLESFLLSHCMYHVRFVPL